MEFHPEDTSNYSVKELIDEIIMLDSRGGYIIPENVVKFHEAVLLKLDISKASNFLKWKPALSFKETVDFTLKGYLDDLGKDKNILSLRLEQIREYTDIAIVKSINWTL